MNVRTIAALGGITLGSLGLLAVMPGSDFASAQTAPVVAPPTVPCPGCGGNPGVRGTGSTVWAWPDHHCNDMGQSSYSITVGVGRNVTGAQTFEWRNADPGADPTWRFLATVQPGAPNATVYPVVTVEPGQTVVILVRVSGGAQFGSGGTTRTFALTCPCEQPTTTSSPTTTTVPPSSPSTTVPGQPTTSVPPGSSAPGTTQPFRLPDTGATSWPLVAAGAVVLLAGAGSLLVVRKREDER